MKEENKEIKQHSDEYWVRAFGRYLLIDDILDSNDWNDLENRLRKIRKDNCSVIMKRAFDEFKFYNCVLRIEYLITDLLNNFLIKENKIKDWEQLKNKFLEKVQRNLRITKEKAKEIIKKETGGEIKRLLTPHKMLYCAGFTLGELLGYIDKFTNDFPQKKQLLSKLEEFNKSRRIVVHNLLTSREDVEKRIEIGISLTKEISNLVEGLTSRNEEVEGGR